MPDLLDDDEELSETPEDVVGMLGFDPKAEIAEDFQPALTTAPNSAAPWAAEDSVGHLHMSAAPRTGAGQRMQAKASNHAGLEHHLVGLQSHIRQHGLGEHHVTIENKKTGEVHSARVSHAGVSHRSYEHGSFDAIAEDELKAAGVIYLTSRGNVLWLRRSDAGDHAGEWCFPAGKIEEGETPEQAAKRETSEETSYSPEGVMTPYHRTADFMTFLCPVEGEFQVVLNAEHTAHAWAPLTKPPQPVHPAITAILKKIQEQPKANDSLAFDRESVRSYDADGRLHVELTPISKANICEYYGREIPGSEELKLDPDKRYKLYRDPEELARGASTFNNLQVLKRHVPVSADDHQPDEVIGSTGTDAIFVAPYLKNSLVIWAKDAIDDVEKDVKKELSSAYRYRADMTPGKCAEGSYDGVMRDIVGNHVAVVKEGRVGHDVVVGDSAMIAEDEWTDEARKAAAEARKKNAEHSSQNRERPQRWLSMRPAAGNEKSHERDQAAARQEPAHFEDSREIVKNAMHEHGFKHTTDMHARHPEEKKFDRAQIYKGGSSHPGEHLETKLGFKKSGDTYSHSDHGEVRVSKTPKGYEAEHRQSHNYKE
jgi:8-oxo-dGTP pyrophosphatase MutT (NUDIX family)